MNLHASLRLANAMSLGLVLCAGLAACGGDTDHPKTLDALRADAEAVSAGRTPASVPRLAAEQAASARDAF